MDSAMAEPQVQELEPLVPATSVKTMLALTSLEFTPVALKVGVTVQPPVADAVPAVATLKMYLPLMVADAAMLPDAAAALAGQRASCANDVSIWPMTPSARLRASASCDLAM